MSKASNGWIQKRGKRYRARVIVDGIEWSESFDTKSLASDFLGQVRERQRLGRLRQSNAPLPHYPPAKATPKLFHGARPVASRLA